MTSTRNVRGVVREKKIIAAATELFAAKGFRAVSLREVAAASGITHPTLLHYFPSKEDLLNAVLAEKDNYFLAKSSIPSSVSDVIRGIKGVKEDNIESPDLIRLLMTLVADSAETDHPAHARFQERYEFTIKNLADNLSQIQDSISGLKAKSGVFILVGVLRFSVIVLPSLFGARGLLLW